MRGALYQPATAKSIVLVLQRHNAGAPKVTLFVIIKSNHSSVSWRIGDATNWKGVKAAVLAIRAQGHDVIDRAFIVNGSSMISLRPFVMPPMRFQPTDPWHLRSHTAESGRQGFHPRIYLIKAFQQHKSDAIGLSSACRWSRAPR